MPAVAYGSLSELSMAFSGKANQIISSAFLNSGELFLASVAACDKTPKPDNPVA